MVEELQENISHKFLNVSDLHLGIWEKYSQPCDDLNTRFHHQRELLHNIRDIAYKNKANIVFNGDMFDKRASIPTYVMNLAFKELKAINDNMPDNCYIFINNGNHDNYDNSAISESAIDSFPLIGTEEHPIRTYKEVTTLSNDSMDITFLPYSEDIDTFKKDLYSQADEIKDDNKLKILFAHIGVEGSNSGRSLHRLGGAYTVEDLHPEEYLQVAMGHYHLRQSLRDNIFYGGTVEQLSYNEEGQEKGVHLIDLDKNEVTFHPLKSPMFITIDLANTKLTNKDIKELSVGNFVKVITSAPEDTKEYMGEDNLQVVQNTEQEFKPRLGLTVNDTTVDIISKYADDKYTTPVKKKALSILDKVSN